MKFQIALFLALAATTSAQTTEQEAVSSISTTISTTVVEPVPTTPNPGLPYGSVCNSLIAQCNRYTNTVSCVQRRADPTTTTTASPTTDGLIPTDNPLMSLLRKAPTPQDVCETGVGAVLGKCQCSRNCKEGVYVEDGEFDEERQLCVGLVGSRCSLLVPNCIKNGRCNLLASTCVCEQGYAPSPDRRCVAVA